MPAADQLQALGQQLTSVLVNAYGINFPNGHLVFLPGGLNVPDDIVQAGVVNPTQLQTWLSVNFDYPFVISSNQAAVLTRDDSHGQASQIYSLAVSQAQPTGAPADDGWNRVDGEIAAARRLLGPPEAQKSILCEPDDWPLPSTNGYWTNFDSSQTDSSSSSTTVQVPIVNRKYWMLRSLAVAPAVTPPSPPPVTAAPGLTFSRQTAIGVSERFPVSTVTTARSPLIESRVAPRAVLSPAASVSRIAVDPVPLAGSQTSTLEVARWRSAVDVGRFPRALNAETLFSSAQPVSTVTTSDSSTIAVHLEHQCVTLGRYTGGQSWWDGVFLADPAWRIPGMVRGGLLPAPSGSETDALNGLPVAMIVVQHLRVTGQWSQAALDTLGASGGTLGPLSLFGAKASTNADKTVTFAHDGMQVVALLCSPLPVLPPQA